MNKHDAEFLKKQPLCVVNTGSLRLHNLVTIQNYTDAEKNDS